MSSILLVQLASRLLHNHYVEQPLKSLDKLYSHKPCNSPCLRHHLSSLADLTASLQLFPVLSASSSSQIFSLIESLPLSLHPVVLLLFNVSPHFDSIPCSCTSTSTIVSTHLPFSSPLTSFSLSVQNCIDEVEAIIGEERSWLCNVVSSFVRGLVLKHHDLYHYCSQNVNNLNFQVQMSTFSLAVVHFKNRILQIFESLPKFDHPIIWDLNFISSLLCDSSELFNDILVEVFLNLSSLIFLSLKDDSGYSRLNPLLSMNFSSQIPTCFRPIVLNFRNLHQFFSVITVLISNNNRNSSLSQRFLHYVFDHLDCILQLAFSGSVDFNILVNLLDSSIKILQDCSHLNSSLVQNRFHISQNSNNLHNFENFDRRTVYYQKMIRYHELTQQILNNKIIAHQLMISELQQERCQSYRQIQNDLNSLYDQIDSLHLEFEPFLMLQHDFDAGQSEMTSTTVSSIKFDSVDTFDSIPSISRRSSTTELLDESDPVEEQELKLSFSLANISNFIEKLEFPSTINLDQIHSNFESLAKVFGGFSISLIKSFKPLDNYFSDLYKFFFCIEGDFSRILSEKFYKMLYNSSFSQSSLLLVIDQIFKLSVQESCAKPSVVLATLPSDHHHTIDFSNSSSMVKFLLSLQLICELPPSLKTVLDFVLPSSFSDLFQKCFTFSILMDFVKYSINTISVQIMGFCKNLNNFNDSTDPFLQSESFHFHRHFSLFRFQILSILDEVNRRVRIVKFSNFLNSLRSLFHEPDTGNNFSLTAACSVLIDDAITNFELFDSNFMTSFTEFAAIILQINSFSNMFSAPDCDVLHQFSDLIDGIEDRIPDFSVLRLINVD
ncbi:hypothetical protein GEMRC1_007301 [Eukaryota sp. GEM-RC1]